jgi:hypothetical protein
MIAFARLMIVYDRLMNRKKETKIHKERINAS